MIEWHSLSIFKHKSGAAAPVDYLSTFATAPFILLPDSSQLLSVSYSRTAPEAVFSVLQSRGRFLPARGNPD